MSAHVLHQESVNAVRQMIQSAIDHLYPDTDLITKAKDEPELVVGRLVGWCIGEIEVGRIANPDLGRVSAMDIVVEIVRRLGSDAAKLAADPDGLRSKPRKKR